MSAIIYSEPKSRVCLTHDQLEIILNRCRLNQRGAQKELYSNYYGYAMAIALRYSSNKDNAVEMTNDAFLKMFKGLKNFRSPYNNTVASFTAWFKTIVVYSCIDHVRKYNKKEILTSVEPEMVVLADARETVEQMLQHKGIINCIQKLSPTYKTVFNLYVIDGFSHGEIAEKLNISEGTSKSNLHKAKQNLKELLKRVDIVNYERAL